MFIDAKITDDCHIYYRTTDDFKAWYENNLRDLKTEPVDFITHIGYKYLFSADGFGAAWVRVPNILFTGSVLLLRADCEQYFYSLLEPMKTHVNIDPGLINLDYVYEYLEKNPKIAEVIGENGRIFAETYLTKEAIDCYLTRVIYDLNDAYRETTGLKQNLKLVCKKIIYQGSCVKYWVVQSVKGFMEMLYYKKSAFRKFMLNINT